MLFVKTPVNELYKNHIIHRLRQRSHIILMSNNGMNIKTISTATGLDRDTISMLMDRWESTGIIGLYDGERSGRPRIFDADNEAKIIEKIEYMAKQNPAQTTPFV